jgi:hypothetical protein
MPVSPWLRSVLLALVRLCLAVEGPLIGGGSAFVAVGMLLTAYYLRLDDATMMSIAGGSMFAGMLGAAGGLPGAAFGRNRVAAGIVGGIVGGGCSLAAALMAAANGELSAEPLGCRSGRRQVVRWARTFPRFVGALRRRGPSAERRAPPTATPSPPLLLGSSSSFTSAT